MSDQQDVESSLDSGKRVFSFRDLVGKKYRLLITKRNTLTNYHSPAIQVATNIEIEHIFDYYVVLDKGKTGSYLHITAEVLRTFEEEFVKGHSHFAIFVNGLRERTRRNMIYGHSDLLWNVPEDRQFAVESRIISSMYREFLLCNYLEYFPTVETSHFNLSRPSGEVSNWSPALKSIRMSESVGTFHELYSSIFALIGPLSTIDQLASSYQCNLTEHKDRVHHLFPMPLKDLLRYDGKKSMIAYFERVIRSIYPNIGLDEQVKVSIKHHLLEVLFVGIQKKWKDKHGVLPLAERLHCPYHLARDYDGELALVISIILCNSKTNKFEIDVPGGKRELGESPLECALRESWEEIGIDLTGCYVYGTNASDCHSSQWIICQHREIAEYSCYIALHQELWNVLHPSGGTSERDHVAQALDDADMLAAELNCKLLPFNPR